MLKWVLLCEYCLNVCVFLIGVGYYMNVRKGVLFIWGFYVVLGLSWILLYLLFKKGFVMFLFRVIEVEFCKSFVFVVFFFFCCVVLLLSGVGVVFGVDGFDKFFVSNE